MTSSPTPEQTDKLTLEGLMHLAMEMAALFRAAPRSLPGNCLAEYDAKKAQVRDYASRLIAQAAQEAMSDEQSYISPQIAAIIERLHTQDNRITAHPLFAVQQKRVIGGLHSDFATDHAWLYEGELVGKDEAAEMERALAADESYPDGYRRVGYIETWEFVAGCMTEQGCKDFIACNGHNLKEPRIYAYSAYRNAEFIALREWLMSLPAASKKETP